MGVTVTGPHFTVGPSCASFFDAHGTRVSNDTWSFKVESGEEHPAIAPALISPAIKHCIKTDVENGNGDRIAQLQLHQRSAVFLALEGILRPVHMDEVRVRVDYFIIIPFFIFDDLPLSLVIVRDLGYDLRTADVDGIPI